MASLLAPVMFVKNHFVKNLWSKRSAALYALFFIMTFAATYHFMGLKKHFDVPEYMKGRETSFATSMYTSVLAQSNAMPDLTPKTTLARWLFMLQVALGWMWFLLFT